MRESDENFPTKNRQSVPDSDTTDSFQLNTPPVELRESIRKVFLRWKENSLSKARRCAEEQKETLMKLFEKQIAELEELFDEIERSTNRSSSTSWKNRNFSFFSSLS